MRNRHRHTARPRGLRAGVDRQLVDGRSRDLDLDGEVGYGSSGRSARGLDDRELLGRQMKQSSASMPLGRLILPTCRSVYRREPEDQIGEHRAWKASSVPGDQTLWPGHARSPPSRLASRSCDRTTCGPPVPFTGCSVDRPAVTDAEARRSGPTRRGSRSCSPARSGRAGGGGRSPSRGCRGSPGCRSVAGVSPSLGRRIRPSRWASSWRLPKVPETWIITLASGRSMAKLPTFESTSRRISPRRNRP